MKKSTLLLIVLFFCVNLFAQTKIDFTSKGISFQGIARGTDGSSLINETVTVKFEIGDWEETQTLNTDGFGVFSTSIEDDSKEFKELDFANFDYVFIVTVNNKIIYNRKFDIVPYAKAAGNGVPTGCIMPYAGTVTPSSDGPTEVKKGWLLCDGKSITGDKYEELRKVLNDKWGTNLLPDLRGYFLRGVDHGAGTDPDVSSRTDIDGKAIGNGDVVGSYQMDEFKEHIHHSDTTGMRIGFAYDNNQGTSGGTNDFEAEKDHEINLRGVVNVEKRGGTETRPKNAYVNYIIKY